MGNSGPSSRSRRYIVVFSLGKESSFGLRQGGPCPTGARPSLWSLRMDCQAQGGVSGHGPEGAVKPCAGPCRGGDSGLRAEGKACLIGAVCGFIIP